MLEVEARLAAATSAVAATENYTSTVKEAVQVVSGSVARTRTTAGGAASCPGSVPRHTQTAAKIASIPTTAAALSSSTPRGDNRHGTRAPQTEHCRSPTTSDEPHPLQRRAERRPKPSMGRTPGSRRVAPLERRGRTPRRAGQG